MRVSSGKLDFDLIRLIPCESHDCMLFHIAAYKPSVVILLRMSWRSLVNQTSTLTDVLDCPGFLSIAACGSKFL